MDLTTLARVKALAKDAGTANDVFYAQAISGISAAMEREIDRFAERKERTEKFFPDGSRRKFFLAGVPVTAIAEIKNGGSVIAADGYRFDRETGMVEFLSGPVETWDGPLEVKYTGGLAVDTAALVASGSEYLDLALACEKEVLSLWQRKDQLAEQVSESIGGGSTTVTRSQAWLPETKAVLERYRLA